MKESGSSIRRGAGARLGYCGTMSKRATTIGRTLGDIVTDHDCGHTDDDLLALEIALSHEDILGTGARLLAAA